MSPNNISDSQNLDESLQESPPPHPLSEQIESRSDHLEEELSSSNHINNNHNHNQIHDAKCLSYDITLDPTDSPSQFVNGGFKSSFTTIPNGNGNLTHSVDSDESLSNPLDSRVVKAPDGGYGWIVVLASFMCNFTVDGICYTFGLFLPFFMIEFGSGKAITALAGSLLSGCYMTAGVFVSGLVNHFGCRPVAIVGSVVAAIALAISTFVPNVYCLIITYGIITGGFFGLIYLPSIVSVGYYFTTKRALATAIAVCGSGMGAFSFAPMVSWLLEEFHWKVSLRILACLALTCTFYGMLMKPLEAKISDKVSGKDRISAHKNRTIEVEIDAETKKRTHSIIVVLDQENGQTKKSSFWSIFDLSVLKIPAMALLSVANVFGMTGYYIPYVYIAGYAEENINLGERRASSSEAAMLLSAIGISNVLGRIIFGIIADKFAGKRICGSSVKITALLINNCCLMSAALATIAIPYCPTYWVLMADCILFGFSISSYMSLTSIILVDLLDLERLSTTFGLIIFFRGISSIIGPPLAGLLYEFTNSYTGVFVCAGLLIMISSIVHSLVHKYQK